MRKVFTGGVDLAAKRGDIKSFVEYGGEEALPRNARRGGKSGRLRA